MDHLFACSPARLIEHRSPERHLKAPPVLQPVRGRALCGPRSRRHHASPRACGISVSAAVQRRCRVRRDKRAPAHEVQRKSRANTGAHRVRRRACAPERFRALKTSAAARAAWRFWRSSAAVREKKRRFENCEEFCIADRRFSRLFKPFWRPGAQNAPGWWRTCAPLSKSPSTESRRARRTWDFHRGGGARGLGWARGRDGVQVRLWRGQLS